MNQPQQSKAAVTMFAGIAVAGVMIAGVGFYLTMRSTPAEVAQPVPVAPENALATSPAVHGLGEEAGPPAARQKPKTAPTRKPSQPPESARMARELEREQIWTALGEAHDLEPAQEGSAAPSAGAAELLPKLDAEYIQQRIQEDLVPVAVECYDSVLEDRPDAAGKIVMKFTIVGAEDVGGVVEEASVDELGSTLDEPFLRECMRESLMAVTFDPPDEGGRVRVTYPFKFAPGPQGDAAP